MPFVLHLDATHARPVTLPTSHRKEHEMDPPAPLSGRRQSETRTGDAPPTAAVRPPLILNHPCHCYHSARLLALCGLHCNIRRAGLARRGSLQCRRPLVLRPQPCNRSPDWLSDVRISRGTGGGRLSCERLYQPCLISASSPLLAGMRGNPSYLQHRFWLSRITATFSAMGAHLMGWVSWPADLLKEKARGQSRGLDSTSWNWYRAR